jgi:hypothetical protein
MQLEDIKVIVTESLEKAIQREEERAASLPTAKEVPVGVDMGGNATLFKLSEPLMDSTHILMKREGEGFIAYRGFLGGKGIKIGWTAEGIPRNDKETMEEGLKEAGYRVEWTEEAVI